MSWAAFHLAHLFVAQMRERPRGDVVMVSSVATRHNAGHSAPYNVAKSALEALAFTLAKEEQRHGTHVNVVAPGSGRLGNGAPAGQGRAAWRTSAPLDRVSPFGHVCTPTDVARVVLFLVSGALRLRHGPTGRGRRGRNAASVLNALPSVTVTAPDDHIGLYEGLLTTRAIRRYRDEPVPDEALRDILFAATRAPSGSNRQPFRFVVLTDRTGGGRRPNALIGAGARRFWEAKRKADGYDQGSGAEQNSPKARMARTMQHYVDDFESVPVVVLGLLRALPAYRRTSTAPRSTRPARTSSWRPGPSGYGGVMTTWHFAVEAELRALLQIPDDTTIWPPSPWVARSAATARSAAAPCPSWSTANGGGRPRPGRWIPPGVSHTAAGPPAGA